MTKYIIELIADFIGSSSATIDKFLTDLYYFVFYIEKQFQSLGIDWNKIYQVIYEYALIILAIVFIKKMIQTYFLWKSGEDDVSPVHVLLGLFEAIIVMIGFGYMYSFLIDIGGDLFVSLNKTMSQTQFSTADLVEISQNGSFSAVTCIILIIEYLILIWQFIRRGIEILIMRLIVPFGAIGLLNSNGGAFQVMIKKFLQNIATVIVQLLLMFFSMQLANGHHLIYAIAVALICNQTPGFISEFLVVSQGFGVAQKINRAVDTVHDSIGTISSIRGLKKK